jgi:uncharacterized membrane protein YgdD (TMEM256/DUF423 family)
MTWDRRAWMITAGLNGFCAVALGAFAAHGAEGRAAELLRTGAQYQFMHTMATIACVTFVNVGAVRARFAPGAFVLGQVLFSGSLYAMALGGPRWLGAITPLGGLAFLAGWAVLAWAATGLERVRPALSDPRMPG